jgi:flagellar hook-associated protein 1 FlgK
MSLTGILDAAVSSLQTAQTQLRVASTNIANVNTPGYAREVVNQGSISESTSGGGVVVKSLNLAVDQFLRQASYSAQAQSGGAGIVSDMLDQAQSLFGDPSANTGYFNQLGQVFTAFTASTQDPASTVSRNQALSSLTQFLNQSKSISVGLTTLSGQADNRIADNVQQINALLNQINQLNQTVVREQVTGNDTTGAQNAENQAIDSLSSMMNVTVSKRADGGVDIRGGNTLLISRGGAATLSYTTSNSAGGQIQASSPGGGTPHTLQLASGTLQGLVNVRNVQIPAVQAELSQYVTSAVGLINQASNASTAVPPPTSLTGRNTGLDLPTAVSGFTGKTTVAIVDPTGVMATRVDIDFDAGTMTVDGGGPTAFTPATFLATLNASLGTSGSASFNNGALSIQGAGGDGVSIADDPTTPSMKAGRGFSQFFGLNDLITSTGFPYPATGLTGTDPNGFNAGGVITLQINDQNGQAMRQIAVNVPGGGTMDDLLTALNDTTTGVGLYGAFSLDPQGRLVFSPIQPGVSTSVVSDTTQRGVNGPSMTDLFGMEPNKRNQRAAGFQVRGDIASNSMLLPMAQLDLTATAGSVALSPGDSRGAQLLANAGTANTTFDPAGSFGALTTTLTDYGSQLSGAIAQQASMADTAKTNADSVASEAVSRRASVEGVNLDEELVNLTTYQQSYNASARVLQAASDLYQILLQLT